MWEGRIVGHDNELKQSLVEIRDNQRFSLRRQEEHLEVALQQIERVSAQVAESIELQKVANERAKSVVNRDTGRIDQRRADCLSDRHVLVGATAVDPVGAK